MSLEQFLEGQAAEGSFEGDGNFTLDLSKAADKLAAFALPSHSHYLLKLVQVAHHLGAESLEVCIEPFRTVLRFHATKGGAITDSEAVYHAFCDPLEIKDMVMKDLVSGLLGTITEQNLETLWSYSHGHSGRRVFINRQRRFSIEDFVLSRPRDPDLPPYSYTLSVLHPRSWKFWLGARRRAEAQRVVEENCRHSGVRISIDRRETEINTTSELNAHLKRSQRDQYSGYLLIKPLAALNVLYQLAPENSQRLSVLRPSLSAYVVRGEIYNVWAQGTRIYNTLEPDGESSAAWVLQFHTPDGSISMRHVPKRVECRAVLLVNRDNRGSESPLRLKVVRSGVQVLDKVMDKDDTRFRALKGCVLLFCGHELETDLTGLQVVENDAFTAKVLEHARLLPEALDYAKQAEKLLTRPGGKRK